MLHGLMAANSPKGHSIWSITTLNTGTEWAVSSPIASQSYACAISGLGVSADPSPFPEGPYSWLPTRRHTSLLACLIHHQVAPLPIKAVIAIVIPRYAFPDCLPSAARREPTSRSRQSSSRFASMGSPDGSLSSDSMLAQYQRIPGYFDHCRIGRLIGGPQHRPQHRSDHAHPLGLIQALHHFNGCVVSFGSNVVRRIHHPRRGALHPVEPPDDGGFWRAEIGIKIVPDVVGAVSGLT